ncbi:MAG: metallophosphoesterase family protein [Rikenellaceae bacterium]
MKIVGILSDTHGTFDEKLSNFFSDVDILLHAGDIGGLNVADQIAVAHPLEAVYGNIDDHRVRIVYPEYRLVTIENVKILITHIGGYPAHYYSSFLEIIKKHRPQIVICGHSHILKVMYDKTNDHLHINPGAAGVMGFHRVRTAIRLKIDGSRIYDLEVGEWKRG